MAYFCGPVIAAVGAPGDVDTTKRNPLGSRAVDEAGNEYIYLEGVASTLARDWVVYDELFTTARTTATTEGPVAIASAAIVASRYGWYGINGKFAAAAGDVADNSKVYSTATAGRCDDAAVKNSRVLGARWRSTDTSASTQATVQITYPYMPGKPDVTT